MRGEWGLGISLEELVSFPLIFWHLVGWLVGCLIFSVIVSLHLNAIDILVRSREKLQRAVASQTP